MGFYTICVAIFAYADCWFSCEVAHKCFMSCEKLLFAYYNADKLHSTCNVAQL